MREAYLALMNNPAKIETILLAGAAKARQQATPFMATLRHAVGLRRLADQAPITPTKSVKAALPSFKQYREADGQFRFKLVDAQGRLLLQSCAFESPKLAAQTIARLQREGTAHGGPGRAGCSADFVFCAGLVAPSAFFCALSLQAHLC